MSEAVAVKREHSRRLGAFEKRAHEIDFVRGVLIIVVLLDHIMNNFMIHSNTWYEITGIEFWHNMYLFSDWYWFCPARQLIRQICLIAFCYISGISCAFSKNNWKRAGLMILVFGLLQVITNLLQAWNLVPGTTFAVDFNIIGVLAFSTLFYCFVQNQSWKGLTASMLLWLLFSTYGMDIVRTIPGTEVARVPALVDPLFTPADWMPIVPYIAFFFMGAITSYFFYQDRKSKLPRGEWERPICFIGRHTIYIYLGHQVVFVSLFILITAIVRAAYGA